MKPSRTFNVAAQLPEQLEPLWEIAYNMRWCWDHDAIELFRRIDQKIWDETKYNPIRLLGLVSHEQIQACAADQGFLAHMEGVLGNLMDYMSAEGWATQATDMGQQPWVAYFSAEFGINECLPLYSGGLGVLAGDYLKSASDLNLPVVGVGILYRQGYLEQHLNADGWQQEEYVNNDFYNSPVRLVHRDGKPVTIDIPHPNPPARAQVWCVQVGRVPLYLLDTNLPGNSEEARCISNQLYAQGGDMRIQQEVLLGIGGVRMLAALGVQSVAFHMNEGHSAFLFLERVRVLMQQHGLSFEEARIAACAGNVFTTHTPVPAGSDRFGPELVEHYLGGYIHELGVDLDTVMELGNEGHETQEYNNALCTTVFALRSAAYSFGVSKLHGKVSRSIWSHVWPDVPEQDVPISSVTNGVHIPSWVSREIASLFDRYLSPRWLTQPSEHQDWERIENIPDEELWQMHELRRRRLVAFARQRLRERLMRHGAPSAEIEASVEALDPKALTIVFARRFATYKRAPLLFHDLDRLHAILTRTNQPLQIIYAGKAHPADVQGKELIKDIIHRSRDEKLCHRIVFIENYDMRVARYLVKGADIWLNTPRRPLEASGTSGMKAGANGALNLSVLDGWWAEGYRTGIGWVIGRGEEYEDPVYQDTVESQTVYDMLEREIVPMFYDRGADGLPREWIKMMKSAIRNICPVFNCNRMVREYMERFYLPAAKRAQSLQQNGFERARQLALWVQRVRQAWPQLQIETVRTSNMDNIRVGGHFQVKALLNLGELLPQDLSVDLYMGRLNGQTDLFNTHTIPMAPQESDGAQRQWFTADVTCDKAGQQGFSVRVLPHHEDLHNPYELGCILWE